MHNGNVYSLSILQSAGRAFEGMNQRLFKPFDLGKWFALGFSAWLAHLLDSNGSTISFNPADLKSLQGMEINFGEIWSVYGAFIVAGLVGTSIFVLAVLLVFLWLDARGKFMFLRNVVDNTAKVSEPWHHWRVEANSLFRWQIGFILVSFGLMASLIVFAGLLYWPQLTGGAWSAINIGLTATLIFAFILITATLAIIQLLLNDFVVPVMMKYRLRTHEAWSLLFPLLRKHALHILLYLLFKMVLMVGIIMGIGTLGVLTCCCYFILLVIPYINAVALLPVTVFYRLFSLEYLRGMGTDFDLLLDQAAPETPPGLETGDGVPSPS